MSEKISEFTILVRDMREAQKLYFTTRYGKDLNKAKELEKQVDESWMDTTRVGETAMNKHQHLSLYRDLPKRHMVRCEHCGEPFRASTARIKRGPVVCFPCRWMIFEQSSVYGNRRDKKLGKLNKPRKYHGRSYTKKRLAEFTIKSF